MTEETKHGEWKTYHVRKCRCDLCTVAWNSYSTARKAERVALLAAGTEPASIHGTVTGYYNWTCRCASCCAAAAQYRLDRRAALRALND